jgi:hypothetical protein
VKAERKEEREKEKGMKKEEASLVCEDMGKESSPRVASGIHRSTFLSVATDRYGWCVCVYVSERENERSVTRESTSTTMVFSSGKAGP